MRKWCRFVPHDEPNTSANICTQSRSQNCGHRPSYPWIPGNADTVVVCVKDPPFGTRSDPAEANQTIFTFERKGIAHPTFADSQSSPSEG
jgi:hypothetical protein